MLAETSSGDVAVVTIAIVSVVAVAVLIVGVLALTRTLTSIRLSVEQLRAETIPVLEQLQVTMVKANGDLERLDGLLDTARSVTATVDTASRLAFLAIGNPVIKGLAAAAGVARASRSMRKK
ncbi:MAG TPA: hypothetical protein VGH94_01680 [Acidimicrobiales bacterium]|jgi:uncharacterized protein YoxC